MQAVVLAGGMGTRLRPLTHEIPKQMLCIAGVTMLERVVERLARFGVDRVVLSLGYRPDVFIEAYPSGEVAGVESGPGGARRARENRTRWRGPCR